MVKQENPTCIVQLALLYIFKQLNQKRKKSICVTFPVDEKTANFEACDVEEKKEEYGKRSGWQALPPSLKIV